MITAGVDIGSVATKALLLRDGDEILGKVLRPTGAVARRAAEEAFEQLLTQVHMERKDVAGIVSTGYGRRQVDFGDRAVTEISACARGASWRAEVKPRIVVDLGGQDAKAILLDAHGRVEDFVMNDKCAAGTGRFLEVIAHALEVELDRMGELSLHSQSPSRINSTCTVFAESEVISLVARGEKLEDIIAGVHESIAERIATMLSRLPPAKPLLFCGGGAKNLGLREALRRKIGEEIIIPPEPQFVNAIGAALLAADSVHRDIPRASTA